LQKVLDKVRGNVVISKNLRVKETQGGNFGLKAEGSANEAVLKDASVIFGNKPAVERP